MPAEISPKKQGRILVLRALDYGKQEIADELDISRHTVRQYLEQANEEAAKTGKAEEVLLGNIFRGLDYDNPAKLGQAFNDLARQSLGRQPEVFHYTVPETADGLRRYLPDDPPDLPEEYVDELVDNNRVLSYAIPASDALEDVWAVEAIVLEENSSYNDTNIPYLAGKRKKVDRSPRFITRDEQDSDYWIHLRADWVLNEPEEDGFHAPPGTDIAVEITPLRFEDPLRIYREDDYKYRLEELWKNNSTPRQRFDITPEEQYDPW